MQTAVLCLLSAFLPASENSVDSVRFLRLLPDRTETECTFILQRTERGRGITCVTERGDTQMAVTAHYDPRDVLLQADATLTRGDAVSSAQVTVADGKATVKREGHDPQAFDVPPGLIATSAPDWTDTFMLCRLYDRQKGDRQEFAGLWIHPRQPPLRLTFSIEAVGTDTIEHAGRRLKLTRHAIQIRNNSRYVAWADDEGRMVKLMSLPPRAGGTVLVQEGYEKSATRLQPGEK